VLPVGGIWLVKGIDGYVITSAMDTMAESNPMRKEVAHQAVPWLINFNKYPLPVGIACPGCGAAAVDHAVLTHVERTRWRS
jgi:hypothetical protein